MGRIRVLGVLAVIVVMLLAGIPSAVAAPVRGGAPSIVQLGDSVAAGEGTLYGYRYDRESERWTGGDLDAAWPRPYPGCHTSPDAFGPVVADSVGARFTQFACTGAQFGNGIVHRERYGGKILRPPQFGNWTTRRNLNARYDEARPDVVLVTLGADDVHFVEIVTACVENALLHRYLLFPHLECTHGNPGPTVRSDFFAELPRLRAHYRTLVRWIAARAAADRRPVPKIVFTTYPDPLPAGGAQCPDSSWLRTPQLRYLSTLVHRLDRVIRATVDALDDPNVVVADSERAYTEDGADHRWCSRDPWAYGLSIFRVFDPSSLHSQAPFHPTPRGQRAIAALVTPVVRQLLSAQVGG